MSANGYREKDLTRAKRAQVLQLVGAGLMTSVYLVTSAVVIQTTIEECHHDRECIYEAMSQNTRP